MITLEVWVLTSLLIGAAGFGSITATVYALWKIREGERMNVIRINCAGHVDPSVEYYRRGYTEPHMVSLDQLKRAAELLAEGDWEDGPRCLLDVLEHNRE